MQITTSSLSGADKSELSQVECPKCSTHVLVAVPVGTNLEFECRGLRKSTDFGADEGQYIHEWTVAPPALA